MELTKQEIEGLMTAAATRALEDAGVTSGFISRREGQRRWGTWFISSINAGRLQPVTSGGKHNYLLSDIIALRNADMIKSRIQMSI